MLYSTLVLHSAGGSLCIIPRKIGLYAEMVKEDQFLGTIWIHCCEYNKHKTIMGLNMPGFASTKFVKTSPNSRINSVYSKKVYSPVVGLNIPYV